MAVAGILAHLSLRYLTESSATARTKTVFIGDGINDAPALALRTARQPSALTDFDR